jgi:hypothetical protein
MSGSNDESTEVTALQSIAESLAKIAQLMATKPLIVDITGSAIRVQGQ